MGEYLADSGVNQAAISETQKYGHVTYFWNGNRSGKFSEELETYFEVPSDVVPFEQRPWMKCAEITDKLIEMLRSGEYKYLRVNFPNGDMVGHTGNMEATKISMAALDIQLARILPVIDELHGVALITADHGNADEMYELDKKGNLKLSKDGKAKAKTSHTLNPVPCIFYDNFYADKYEVKADENGSFGLANIAATTVNLLGYDAPDMWCESMITIK
jgi:2,3-bisphosphoglycerate-independent phosphoglycerate mutase